MNVIDSAWWKHVGAMSILGDTEVYSYTAALEYKIMAKGGHEQFENGQKSSDNTHVSEALLHQISRPDAQVAQLDSTKHSPENVVAYNSYLNRVASGDITAVDPKAQEIRQQYEAKVYQA